MKVSKSIYKILFIIAGAMAATACSDEQYEINKAEEGLPASVTLSLSVPSALETTMTRATDVQETNVEKVAFLFYKKNQPNERPIVVVAENAEIAKWDADKTKPTNYKYTGITIQDSHLTSGEWYLYAVANYGRNGITLDTLQTCTKAKIDELCTTENQITDITETAVLMSGKYGDEGSDGSLTLIPGSNTLKTIKLKRLVAKSTFTIQAGSDITFILQSCELHKYPCSSTLMEREGWGTETETDFTNPGDLPYQGNPAYPVGDKIDITNFKNEGKNGPYTFFFYTQENVQKTKEPNSNNPFTYNMREERESNDYNKFKYAPEDATYVVIKGMYEGPSKKAGGWVTGNVTYTIHLGDFPSNDPNASNTGSYDNFSIRRNVRYNYTVTIAGVDKIIAEAKAENDFQNGAEGNIIKQTENTTITVDAHYETVLLKLPTTLGDDYALSVKTPYTQKVYRSSDPILAEEDDIDWIKFGQPQVAQVTINEQYYPFLFHSYTDLYNNNYGGLCNIKDLLQELKSGGENPTHMIKEGSYYYVTAYINEYYYYADEEGNLQTGKNISEFINADDREMTLAQFMYISQDGHSTYTETPIFSIKQKSIKSCFNLEKCPNPFGIETIEETDPERLWNTWYGNEGENGYSDGWYYNALSTNVERDGHGNTLATGGGENGIVGKSWDLFINQAYNGYIDRTMENTKKFIMNTDYNYSIYQFLTRNRDLDGDGKIDAKEIRWYIPAHQQCMELWYGENSLPTEARLKAKGRNYLTSTRGVSRTWWADEGSAFGYWKYTKDDNDGYNAVRVVRSLKNYAEETTPLTDYKEDERIVTINYLADANLRTTSMTGNYVEHWTGEEADKLPRKFKIAKDYHLKNTTEYTVNKIATDKFIGNTYSEDDDLSDKGKWRVPNEKELGLMLQWIPDLETNTIGRTRYRDNRYYYVEDNNGKFITTNEKDWKDSSPNWWEEPIPRHVRLVRDVVE